MIIRFEHELYINDELDREYDITIDTDKFEWPDADEILSQNSYVEDLIRQAMDGQYAGARDTHTGILFTSLKYSFMDTPDWWDALKTDATPNRIFRVFIER